MSSRHHFTLSWKIALRVQFPLNRPALRRTAARFTLLAGILTGAGLLLPFLAMLLAGG